MQDKTFELLEKMYSEINKRFDSMYTEINKRFDSTYTEMNERFDSIDKRFDSIDKRFDSVQEDIKQILETKADKTDIVRLENVHGGKIDSLLDGYKQVYEKTHEHDKRFDDIDYKVDNLSLKITSHDTKLEVIEGGKKK
ncbi:MAG TPA: hypothetical protein VFD00_09375 [Thermoclostridium sp.]|nr:hypothetical protein [Thermoclostridium sp.]